MLSKGVSMKELQSEVIRLDCLNTEMRGIFKGLELINQEFLEKRSEKNRNRGNYVDWIWMIEQVPMKYLKMGLAVDYRTLKWGRNETCGLEPCCGESVPSMVSYHSAVSKIFSTYVFSAPGGV